MADNIISEEWRIVEAWPEYEVSSLGRVKRVGGGAGAVPGRILRQFTGTGGYLRVMVKEVRRNRLIPCNGRGPVSVHILVCEAFHGPRPAGLYAAAHNNGINTDNRADNLRWATYQENSDDRIAHGNSCRGSQNPKAVLTEEQVLAIKSLLLEGISGVKIAARFSVSPSTVSLINRRKVWAWLTAPGP
jgi:hypothetical protein